MNWAQWLDVIRDTALVVLILSNCYRLLVMQRFTRHWNGLGRAMRAEVAFYALLWSWALGRLWWAPLRDPLLYLVIVSGLIAVTILVTVRLPRGDGRPGDTAPPRFALPELAAALPVVVADASGTILYASGAAAALAGWPLDELEGQNLIVLIPGRYRARHRAGLQRFVTTGESRIIGRVVNVDLLRRDGREVPISLALTATERAGAVAFVGCLWERDEEIEV